VVEQLFVDAIGGAPQRQLAQRGQIAGREIMLQRALGLLGHIDLALLEPLDQIVGVRSISSMASARSKIESGTVSRTRTWVICATHIVEALDVLVLTAV